jgi:polyhydroxyalkanoate synthesis regulator phasin
VIVDAIMKVLDIILEQVARGVISLEEARKLARESISKMLEAEQLTDEKRAALHAEVDAMIHGTAKTMSAPAVEKKATGLLADDGSEVK